MGSDTKACVLVVDDRPEKLLATEAILSDMPLEVVSADSGRAALRQVLQRDFAVILLDVDMPIMDGFEAAALIRQRKQSEHVPIIFMTAYSDNLFMERGYSLGAVDYILQPVVPDVLRAKVAVFVDLYENRQQVKEQAEWHRRRADQMQRLAQASIRINSATTIDQIVESVTEAARQLIEMKHAMTAILLPGQTPLQVSATSPRPAIRSEGSTCPQGHWNGMMKLTSGLKSVRARAEEAPKIPGLGEPDGLQLLAAQLTYVAGAPMGFIEAVGEDFSADDEVILVLLAQMASITIENALSAEARDANRAKDQFLAVLSHELRTPLTPALAALSELTLDQRLPAEVQGELQMVQHNVELEARLIDDLLDLTRISKGKIDLRLSRVDAHAVLDEALKVCQVDIAGTSLRVRCEYRAEHSQVRADVTRLKQVFWNLVKNSVKFTPSGGSIFIESENSPDGSLIIRVSDTGIGIEAADLPRIFNAFEQGNQSISRQFGGLGLGLAITKALVERHHGSISAASEGRGKGAVFTLKLPLDCNETAESIAVLPRLVGSGAPRRLKILLVEDHVDTARVLKRLLVKQMHDVSTARNVAEALEIAGRAKFDLVISDIGLPDGSGLELMPQLRSRGATVGIALSGFGMEEDVLRSRAAGFREHLTKPLNFQTLSDCIERICKELDESTNAEPMAG